MIGRTDERRNPGWPVVYKYRPSVRMSFAEPIWARGHVAAQRGRTHDRFRTVTNFAESPLTFPGRPHMGQRSWRRVDKAGHMIAIDPPVRILIFPLASEGPSTHAPTPRRCSQAIVTCAGRISAWIAAVSRFASARRSPSSARPACSSRSKRVTSTSVVSLVSNSATNLARHTSLAPAHPRLVSP